MKNKENIYTIITCNNQFMANKDKQFREPNELFKTNFMSSL